MATGEFNAETIVRMLAFLALCVFAFWMFSTLRKKCSGRLWGGVASLPWSDYPKSPSFRLIHRGLPKKPSVSF